MKFALLAILSALFVSCASNAPLPPVPPPPPKAVPVAPAASKLREDIASIDRAAGVINQNASEAAAAASQANDEALRLKNQGGASAEEMDKVYQLTQVLVSRNASLLSQCTSLSTSLVAARTTAAALQEDAAKRDEEVELLRGQLTAANASLNGYRDEAARAVDGERKAAVDAAHAKGEMETANLLRNVALGVAVAIALMWAFVKFVLKR